MNVNDFPNWRIFTSKFTGTWNTCRARNTLIVYVSATQPCNCTRGYGHKRARTRENTRAWNWGVNLNFNNSQIKTCVQLAIASFHHAGLAFKRILTPRAASNDTKLLKVNKWFGDTSFLSLDCRWSKTRLTSVNNYKASCTLFTGSQINNKIVKSCNINKPGALFYTSPYQTI